MASIELEQDQAQVRLRGSVKADVFVLGGRRGNIVTSSRTPEVLKGWKLIWLNGEFVTDDAGRLATQVSRALRQPWYEARFWTGGTHRARARKRPAEKTPPAALETDHKPVDPDSHLHETVHALSTPAGSDAGEIISPRVSCFKKPSAIYEEIRYLGSGAFGSAFVVRKFQNGHQYAAKKVSLEHLRPDQRQACLDEICLLRRVQHRFVAQYIDFLWESEDRTSFWLLQKLYPGGDVQRQIEISRDRGEKLDKLKVLKWLVQLCRALKHVHSLSIVHCDVKGSNMFISGADNVVLGDFGVSKQLDACSKQTESLAGSPSYMAPERFDGGIVSSASDMWAVGIVAYELVALSRPFEAFNLLSLVYKIGNEAPAELTSDICDEALWKVIQQLLQKNPRQRPSAAQALADPYLGVHAGLFNVYHEALEAAADALSRTKELTLRESTGILSGSDSDSIADAPDLHEEGEGDEGDGDVLRVEGSTSWDGAVIVR
eukprot:TRINITY_DN90798_c0_g1_i1.p1 TRINITY_DN90798_c0_g1~~TRINITY_DN90798_c0_g1_i1.p1  ORF type:complete len:489 (+),score=58.99 TRINITY_DN90798_c0_g1_i1:149-1615(+)